MEALALSLSWFSPQQINKYGFACTDDGNALGYKTPWPSHLEEFYKTSDDEVNVADTGVLVAEPGEAVGKETVREEFANYLAAVEWVPGYKYLELHAGAGDTAETIYVRSNTVKSKSDGAYDTKFNLTRNKKQYVSNRKIGGTTFTKADELTDFLLKNGLSFTTKGFSSKQWKIATNVEALEKALEYKREVVALYQQCNPAKLAEVDDLIEKYPQNSENNLIKLINAKYSNANNNNRARFFK